MFSITPRRGGAFATFLLILLTLGASSPANALPSNFRNIDRFFVGGMPDVDEIDQLHMLGVDTIISFHRMPQEVRQHAEALGMKTHFFKIRPHMHLVEEAATIIDNRPTGTVYVHCQYGADRTGLFVAYWLHTRVGYELFDALLTVVAPNDYQVEGLRRIFLEYSWTFVQDEVDGDLLGRYSGSYLGHGGGMKVRGEAYARGVKRLLYFVGLTQVTL